MSSQTFVAPAAWHKKGWYVCVGGEVHAYVYVRACVRVYACICATGEAIPPHAGGVLSNAKFHVTIYLEVNVVRPRHVPLPSRTSSV